jgi:hypothetical protein
MLVQNWRSCLIIVLAVTAGGLLRGDQIQVGTADTVSVKPFGDDTVTAYEQLYTRDSFGGLTGDVNVSALEFLIDTSIIPIDPTDPTLQPYPGQYQVTLTELTPGSGLDVSSNILGDLGASPILNSTATLNLTTDPTTGDVTGGALILTLDTPFSLDPTQDLLLDVQQAGVTPWTLFALQADSSLNSAALDSASCSTGCGLPLGLVTDFVETPVSASPVPEPAADGMLLATAIGLLGIFSARRKTRRNQ